MPNAYSTNFSLNSAGEFFHAMWKMTRTMMAAGWRWKACGNGQIGGTSNVASWTASGTGASGQTSTFSTPVLTLTNLQGMSPGVVGQWITISGSSHSGNNGTFLILSYVSSSSVTIYNTGGVASDTGPLTWSLVRDSALDLWGQSGNVNLSNVSGGGSGTGTGVALQLSLALSGTFSVTNGSATVSCSTSQANILYAGAPITFAAQAGIVYYLASFNGTTSMTLSTAASFTSTSTYTGTTNSTTTATTSANGWVTLTGVTGFSQSASPGRIVTITGSSVGNNGNYRIVAVNAAGTSVTIYAPNIVPETGNSSLVATEQYGGNAATISTFTTTTSGQSTLITITGLSGLTVGTSSSPSSAAYSPDINRKIRILNPSNSGNLGSFTIVSVPSTTSAVVYAPFAVQNDYGVGGTSGSPTLQWVEWDPLQQIYPNNISYNLGGAGAWGVWQGPTIVKIPIGSNVVTGTFIRGENVTQTTTGAQGELLGYMPDATNGTGFLVIAPRVIGTGVQAGPATDTNMTYGWNNTANTDTVTGAISGATVTTPASSTPVAYIREMMVWKYSLSQGHIYHQCIDQNPSGTEAVTGSTTGRFSIMAGTLSQISSIQGPGTSNSASVSSNGFPSVSQGASSWTGTYVVLGSGGQAASGSPATGFSYFDGQANSTSPGRCQILCANNIEYQLNSADGTWGYWQSCNSVGYQGLSYQRVDNQEDGDLDPYIHLVPGTGATTGTPNRYQDDSGTGSATDNMNTLQNWYESAISYHGWKGFRRRGLNVTGNNQTLEYYSWFDGYLLYAAATSNYVLAENSGNPDQVATAPGTSSGYVTPIYVREPIWLCLTSGTGQNNGVRMRKGTPRWMFATQGGTVNATFDSKQWLILSSTAIMFVVGPYDGNTTPSF
jgi:hypothetical protein